MRHAIWEGGHHRKEEEEEDEPSLDQSGQLHPDEPEEADVTRLMALGFGKARKRATCVDALKQTSGDLQAAAEDLATQASRLSQPISEDVP